MIAAVAVAVLLGGAVGVGSWVDRDRTSISPTPEAAYALPVTAESVGRLVTDHRSEFDTTRSYGISLQQALSTVRVPTGDGRARYREWRPAEDGGFVEPGDPRGAGELRDFDLADVDVAALERNIAMALSVLDVEGPQRVSLVIEHWHDDDRPVVVISVSNDYDESGYLRTELDGRVIETRPYAPA